MLNQWIFVSFKRIWAISKIRRTYDKTFIWQELSHRGRVSVLRVMTYVIKRCHDRGILKLGLGLGKDGGCGWDLPKVLGAAQNPWADWNRSCCRLGRVRVEYREGESVVEKRGWVQEEKRWREEKRERGARRRREGWWIEESGLKKRGRSGEEN